MSLEDICPVEALLRRASTARTESTYHGTLVVGQGVSILVVLPGKAFDVIFARHH